MTFLILFAIILPVLSGFCLLLSKYEDRTEVHNFSLIVLGITAVVTVATNILNIYKSCTLLTLPMGMTLGFTVDTLAVFFSSIFVVIWLVVGIYSREYFKKEGKDKRFMSFYLMALGAVIGVCYADNPFTFYTFFELMSLTSFVFVLHGQNKESIAAAKKYIYYSIFGALCGLIGIMSFYGSDIFSDKSFVAKGAIESANMPLVLVITFIAIIGFGCKAGMFPLHSWIPYAYVEAPAPASAVLSGAIAKTGVLAIIRIIFFVVGPDTIRGTWVQYAVLILAIMTVFMGSMMAYKEQLFQRRVAYSSVSQVSYAVLGVMMLNIYGLIGALLQVLFHALSKNVLFLTSGAITYKTGRKYVHEMTGLGKAMPATFALFTFAGMSLAGVPLTGGFVSKFFLAQSALQNDVIGLIGFAVIIVSALLTAGYIWQVSSKALFAHKLLEEQEKCEINATMLVPMLVLVVLIIAIGICPSPFIDLATAVVMTSARF